MTPRPRPSHIVRERGRRLRGGMMTWNVVIEDGVTFVEASSAAPAPSADVTTALPEGAFAGDTRAALLYAEQLPRRSSTSARAWRGKPSSDSATTACGSRWSCRQVG